VNDRDLDALLSAPLAPVEDLGFSARLAQGIVRRQRAWDVLLAVLAAGFAGIFFQVMPLGQAGGAIDTLSQHLASSVPLAVAIAMVVLSNSLLRWMAE